MSERGRRILFVFFIIFLLPYVLTVFFGGKEVFQQDKNEVYVNVMVDGETCSVKWKDFLLGVVAKEIPSDYSNEAVKAQIVLARTRLLYEANSQNNIMDDSELDKNIMETRVENYIYTDAFYGLDDLEAKWGKADAYEVYVFLEKMIEETDGGVLYFDGKLAVTPYHMLNNGMTRDGSEVFAGDYPYLVSKTCPLDVEAEKEVTMVTLTLAELEEKLNLELDLALKDMKYEDIEIVEADEAGYVLTVSVQNHGIDGEVFRSVLGLKSSSFTFEKEEKSVRITTQGVGHGLGLSQNTAHYMGLEGKSYAEILEYFYQNIQIESFDNL